MRSFVKIKSSQNSEITLSFTDIENSCPSREFLVSQISLLTLFVKIKFSRKFPDLQYLLIYFSNCPISTEQSDHTFNTQHNVCFDFRGATRYVPVNI